MIEFEQQLLQVIESGRMHISTIRPSDWTEENIMMGKPFPGKFSYKKTPYVKEIINCLSPDHPSRVVSVMKGAQIGFSSGVIYPGIGWIMANQPGNTYLSVGNTNLIEKSMDKIDTMINSAGLRHLIKPNVVRNKAGKTGDTNTKKEFPNGYLLVSSANNHSAIRQIDLQYIFMDDFDAVKRSSKESGNTRKLIEQRAAAYYDKSKIFFVSTPELKPSNIEEVYSLGDQRKYLVPCPCCGVFIDFRWSIHVDEKNTAGITWKTDTRGRLIKDSVGYICQECGGFFKDSKKDYMLNEGLWKPSCEAEQEGYYSYHVSSLYAPAGMFDWAHYVSDYIAAHPEGQARKEDLYKTFVNLCLGEPYEALSRELKANDLQKNTRNYSIGTIPEKLSEKDGNGKIILITCACDLNGTVEDARLDYEIVGWSVSGATYSIDHGSIGTFIPREGSIKFKEDRERWTYEHGRPNSVWKKLDEVLGTVYVTDTGRKMKIFISGIDCGHYTDKAYTYIDNSNFNVVGVRGKDIEKFVRVGLDNPSFRPAKERANLYLVEVNMVKDQLAEMYDLKWNSNHDECQPPGFMNFPIPSDGKYLLNNFFSHYEAEHKSIDEKAQQVIYRWVKKNTNVQNHFFDVRVYGIALRDILVWMIGKELKIQKPTWSDYVKALGL